jgi:hypothetical protein
MEESERALAEAARQREEAESRLSLQILNLEEQLRDMRAEFEKERIARMDAQARVLYYMCVCVCMYVYVRLCREDNCQDGGSS